MYWKKPTSLELSVNLLRAVMWLTVILLLLYLATYLYNLLTYTDSKPTFKSLLIVGGTLKTLFFYILSTELKKRKKWARITTIVVGILMLPWLLVYTVVGIILIYNMTKGWSNEDVDTTNKSEEPIKNPQADSWLAHFKH